MVQCEMKRDLEREVLTGGFLNNLIKTHSDNFLVRISGDCAYTTPYTA